MRATITAKRLRRDATDLRLNNGYGKYLYNKGLFAESEGIFPRRHQDCHMEKSQPLRLRTVLYNLGLALLRQGKQEAAFDAFYKATWDGSMQGARVLSACLPEFFARRV